MLTIHKFVIPFGDKVTIQMPDGAEILTLQKQGNNYCIWAKVDTASHMVPREFVWHGTGTRESMAGNRYVGTIQDDPFVWHLFEDQSFYTVTG